MQDLHSTIYLPRAEALNLPVRRSRSQAEPLAPRAVRPGGAMNPQPRRGCQPSGIQRSTESLTKAHHLKYRTQQKSTNHNS